MEVLREYHEGIIALSACLAGIVPEYIQKGLYEDAKLKALELEEVFGKGNFFLELQDHGITAQKTVNQSLLRMSQETGIELVATNDIHYTYAEDEKPHDILLCIQTGKKVADEDVCVMRAASIISNLKRKCANFFHMQSRPAIIPIKSLNAVMWILNSENINCRNFLFRKGTMPGVI